MAPVSKAQRSRKIKSQKMLEGRYGKKPCRSVQKGVQSPSGPCSSSSTADGANADLDIEPEKQVNQKPCRSVQKGVQSPSGPCSCSSTADGANADLDIEPEKQVNQKPEIFVSSKNLPVSHLSKQLKELAELSDDEYIKSYEEAVEVEEKKVGRRIVNVSSFSKKLLELCNHGPLGCSASDMVLIGEKQNGLMSKFTYLCRMCNLKFIIDNDTCEDNYLHLNACAVAGAITIGSGQAQLEELLSAIDLPTVSREMYDKCHEIIYKHTIKVSEEGMKEAGVKEKEMAVASGRVTKDGIGIVDVIVDGCWSKRSYKKNYSALSGAATIIGKNTGKILYMGIKNKYCTICAREEKGDVEKKEHKCYKNYDGPSTGMESQILVEGFKSSVEQHGLIYGRLISDGDSSTYAKILEARPYADVTVEKIECRNHVMRNFCNKLQALTTETKYPIKFRKCITKKSTLSTRGVIIKAIHKHKNNSDVQLLFEDILLSHLHGFGDHSRCKKYFCSHVGTTDNSNIAKEFVSSSLWSRICYLVQGVAGHSRSLIHDVDSNIVEGFHSVVAKYVGGKRVNFSKKNSYELRVHAAASAFTRKRQISRLYKSINGGYSPLGKIKQLEDKRIKKGDINRRTKKPRRRLFNQTSGTNKDYGEGSTQPDIDEETYNRLKINFLENLKKTDEEIASIQKNTILQSESGEWLELRRSLLTASNFGKIIKRRDDTSCASTVKEMLYKVKLDHVTSIKHGHDNEKVALNQLSAQINVEIHRCGLFIDKELQFLGATPDGLIGNDTNNGQFKNAVVEVKCPITAHAIGVEEAIKSKKVTFWRQDGTINKTHNWYYQVQGQLRVTQREKCVFAVWANEKEPLKIEIIKKDDDFWREKMQSKLTNFYMNCILPELVDPRQPRHLPIRDPSYITEAIQKKNDRKSDKNKIIKKTS